MSCRPWTAALALLLCVVLPLTARASVIIGSPVSVAPTVLVLDSGDLRVRARAADGTLLGELLTTHVDLMSGIDLILPAGTTSLDVAVLAPYAGADAGWGTTWYPLAASQRTFAVAPLVHNWRLHVSPEDVDDVVAAAGTVPVSLVDLTLQVAELP